MRSKPRNLGRWYPNYVLCILALVALVNNYDRNLIAPLIEPIKHDLHLSDSQIGLLSGIAFALTYCILAIPLAHVADRHGRARVLSGVLLIWSIMTALTGRAVSFTTMFLARVGVGAGEAGGLPATHALVADYFPPRSRGKALSVIAVCSAVGLPMALAGGGLINDLYGWRMAFYAGCLPGLVLAALVRFTVRETKAAGTGTSIGLDERPAPDLRSAFWILWSRRSYVWTAVGLSIVAIGIYAQATWSPAFLMRSYHLSTGQVGTYYSAAVGPASLVAVLLGGVVNDWLVKRDRRWSIWLLCVSFGASLPFNLAFLAIHHFFVAMVMITVATVVGNLWLGPAFALIQSLAGPRLRAVAAAIYLTVVNIVGLSLGPYVAGALSDALAAHFGPGALGLSISLVLTATDAVGVVIFFLAVRTVNRDMAEADADIAT